MTRPERSALAEAARTSAELQALGLLNQRLVVNGVFHATLSDDPIAKSLEDSGQQALAAMPESPAQARHRHHPACVPSTWSACRP